MNQNPQYTPTTIQHQPPHTLPFPTVLFFITTFFFTSTHTYTHTTYNNPILKFLFEFTLDCSGNDLIVVSTVIERLI